MLLYSVICSLLLVGSSYAAPYQSIAYDDQSYEELASSTTSNEELTPEWNDGSTMVQVKFLPEQPDREIEPDSERGEISQRINIADLPTTTIDTDESDSPNTTPASDATSSSDHTTASDSTSTSNPASPSDPTATSNPTRLLQPIIRELKIPRLTSLPEIHHQKWEILQHAPLREPIAPVIPHPPTPVTTTIVQAPPYTSTGMMPFYVSEPAIPVQQVFHVQYIDYIPSDSAQSPSTQVPVFDYTSQMALELPPQRSGYNLHRVLNPMNFDKENDSTDREVTLRLLQNKEFLAIYADIASKAKEKYHYYRVPGTTAELFEALAENEKLRQILSTAYAEIKQSHDRYESTLGFVRSFINTKELTELATASTD